MVIPVDAQMMSQMASGTGSATGSSSSVAIPNLPDPDPAAAQLFAQTMNGSGSTPPVNPVDIDAAGVKANALAHLSEANLPASVKFFFSTRMEDLFRLRKAVGEWEYQEIRTGKFSQLTGEALDSVTKQSE